MLRQNVRDYLSEIGRRGGRKSRRRLGAEEAKEMVRIREAQRAFRKFHSRCFWSYDQNYKIGKNDVAWVGRELMRNGGHVGFRIGARLCR